MSTATEHVIAREEKRIEDNRAQLRMNDFFEKWAPDDPKLNHKFHVEFCMLIREMHHDLSAVYIKEMTAIKAHTFVSSIG